MERTVYARVRDLDTAGARIVGIDASADDCAVCGHPWREHHLCARSRPPTEGWIECPVKNCECQQTWSVPAETATQLRNLSETTPQAGQQRPEPY